MRDLQSRQDQRFRYLLATSVDYCIYTTMRKRHGDEARVSAKRFHRAFASGALSISSRGKSIGTDR